LRIGNQRSHFNTPRGLGQRIRTPAPPAACQNSVPRVTLGLESDQRAHVAVNYHHPCHTHAHCHTIRYHPPCHTHPPDITSKSQWAPPRCESHDQDPLAAEPANPRRETPGSNWTQEQVQTDQENAPEAHPPPTSADWTPSTHSSVDREAPPVPNTRSTPQGRQERQACGPRSTPLQRPASVANDQDQPTKRRIRPVRNTRYWHRDDMWEQPD